MSATGPATIGEVLPSDRSGILIGRVEDRAAGHPVPVLLHAEQFWTLSDLGATVADLLDRDDLLEALRRRTTQPATGAIEQIALPGGTPTGHTLLAPIDLQAIKACGVTFAGSMIERVIEERSQGDPGRAAQVRAELAEAVGRDLAEVRPGSPESAAVKEDLLARGWWSAYLEVGLGPDPEVFTKAQVLSAVGTGEDVGVPDFSTWNNPEPELVLIVDPRGHIRGATLGNDVNLRDVEGRSALLLGKAKDNNRSTAIGPVIRLFDETFGIDDARGLSIDLTVDGPDGYRLTGVNSVGALSRSFEELVTATMGRYHQYPDGVALFTGTLFAPTEDRDVPGQGFTHHPGDIVTISAAPLGALINRVGRTEDLPPWTYGVRALYAALANGAVGIRG